MPKSWRRMEWDPMEEKLKEVPRTPTKSTKRFGGRCDRASQAHRCGVDLSNSVHPWPEEGLPDAVGTTGPGNILEGARDSNMGDS